MSHPDPLFDPDNSLENDYMYDDHDDFYGESADYSDYNDDMDGDHDSAMTSCGWGTDEDYGYYGGDGREDFHSDEAVGFVDYNEDGPYDD
jgi:hypothetical protein